MRVHRLDGGGKEEVVDGREIVAVGQGEGPRCRYAHGTSQLVGASLVEQRKYDLVVRRCRSVTGAFELGAVTGDELQTIVTARQDD